jgi:hypothetical protein
MWSGANEMNRQIAHRSIQLAAIVMLSIGMTTGSTVIAQKTVDETDGGTPWAIEESAYDSAFSQGFAPDERVAVKHGAQPQTTQQAYSYYMVSGATLRPRQSTTTVDYDSLGCTFVTTSEAILNTELHIPDGSVIKYLRLYYKDTSNTGRVRAFLTRYQPGQEADDMVLATSTASFAGGFGIAVSQELTAVVDNQLNAYTLIGWPTSASSSLQVCGIRIAYYAPASITASYLPSVIKAP